MPGEVTMSKITRKEFIKRGVLTTGALYAGALFADAVKAAPTGLQASSKKPNLLIIFPDQLRADALGYMKKDPVKTPNLDIFAKQSRNFTQASSCYPLCSPFRASLLTGQYPPTNGVLGNCNSKGTPFNNELRQDARCFSDVLKDNGYSLGYIGKWHLDSPREPFVKCRNNEKRPAWNEWCEPKRRHGFDFWYSYGTYDEHMKPMYWDNDAKRDEPHFVDKWGPEHEADLAIEYIKNSGGKYRNSEKPFVLVVSMNPPHTPYKQVPEKYVKQYDSYKPEDFLANRNNIPAPDTKWGKYYRENIKNYFACVTGVDDQFGRIVNSLKENGLDENTVVMFTSDHGDCLGIHDEVSKNNAYEESAHIPLLIRYPAKLKPAEEDMLISTPDIYPTLLSLMGFKSDIPSAVQGVDYSEQLISGKGEKPASQLYYLMEPGEPWGGKRGVRTSRYTAVYEKKKEGGIKCGILLDRVEDPGQNKNLAETNPELCEKLLKEELIPQLKKQADPWLAEK